MAGLSRKEVAREVNEVFSATPTIYFKGGLLLTPGQMQSWVGKKRRFGTFVEEDLDKTTHSEVFLNDDVWKGLAKYIKGKIRVLTIDGAHDKSYLCGIGCASEVGVDLLGLGLVQ